MSFLNKSSGAGILNEGINLTSIFYLLPIIFTHSQVSKFRIPLSYVNSPHTDQTTNTLSLISHYPMLDLLHNEYLAFECL